MHWNKDANQFKQLNKSKNQLYKLMGPVWSGTLRPQRHLRCDRVVDPDPYVYGPPGSYHQQAKKTTILWLIFYFLSLKTDVNLPSKSNKQKNLYFVGILLATDEKSGIRIIRRRIRNRNLVVRIRTKMSRIHKTAMCPHLSMSSYVRPERLMLLFLSNSILKMRL
jgi:hypothetical protein